MSWNTYYDLTKNLPPSDLLIEALPYVSEKDVAIDIGCGALKDTRFLLDQGFVVTALDSDPGIVSFAEKIVSKDLQYHVSSFETFDFPEEEYRLATAMYALPFTKPLMFDYVFLRVFASLKSGGIFCGQFFGIHDEWSTNSEMTFHTKPQIEALLSHMRIIKLEEVEKDGVTANGTPKHWHVFNVIAKK